MVILTINLLLQSVESNVSIKACSEELKQSVIGQRERQVEIRDGNDIWFMTIKVRDIIRQ